MKTRLIVSILVGAIILSTIGYIFIQMSECLYPSPSTNRISYDLNFCLELFVNGYLPYFSEPEPTDGLILTEASPRMNDITRDSDYTKTRDSGNMQINNKSELVLSEKELDTKLESLRMAGLPVVSSGVDYDLGVIVIYTPDPTQIDLFQAQLGNTPFNWADIFSIIFE